MDKRIIATDAAPKAIGPYAQAVAAGGFLFVSGQIPLDPKTGSLVEGPIADQARRVMDNLQAVLQAAGASFNDVVKATVYLVDLNDFAAVNDVYGEYVGDSPPARATVQVAALPRGARVEVELIARLVD